MLKTIIKILVFKLSPCYSNAKLSSGYFPPVLTHTSPPAEDGTDTVFRNVCF